MWPIYLSTTMFLLLGWPVASSAEPGDSRPAVQEPIRQELFTPEERQDYRQTLWDLKTEVERERFQDEQRQMLEERARTLGVSPDFSAYDEMNKPAPDQEERKWPDDGLRRWPEERSADDGLRRWRDNRSSAKDGGKKSLRWPAKGGGARGLRSEPEEGRP